MKQGCFVITYRRMGFKDDCIVERPSRWKMIWWMITTGIWCEGILIAFLEDEE